MRESPHRFTDLDLLMHQSWGPPSISCAPSVEGRPTLKIICRVASVIEERLNDPAERDRFWHVAGARLSKLHRLSPRDRNKIAGMIAGRIPMPVAASQAAE